MKHQIARFSPHQNAKVFAVLMAVGSLVIVIPMSLIFYAAGPAKAGGMSMLPILLAPLFYLVAGYLITVVWCALYNALFKVVGGIEFESIDGVN
jgi:hypothetical protein